MESLPCVWCDFFSCWEHAKLGLSGRLQLLSEPLPPQIPEGFVGVAQDTDISNTDLLCPAFPESPLVEYVGTYPAQPPLSIAEALEIP